MLLGRELRPHRLQCRFEKSSESEETAALRNVHRPKLSRPFILENLPMDPSGLRRQNPPMMGLSISSAMRR
jgi:hypothetical protein